MIETLLLCFIHGFKGDEETFFEFPQDLKTEISNQSPDLKVHTDVYPKYETRGDLASCSETFREWLQDQVTDLETSAATPSAIMNPSVGVVLVAHSMGGFVATDALFSILSNCPKIQGKECMFPLITGILTYDTPYNGLARSMFAYGAFSQYQNVSALYNIWSSLSGGLGLASASSAASSIARAKAQNVPGNKEMKKAVRTVGGVPASSWRRWGLLAARTGTLGAVLAGGVTAYVHREAIGESISKIDLKGIDYDPRSYLKRENIPSMSLPRTMPSLPKGMSAPNLGTLGGLSGVSRESIGEGFAWMAGHLKFVGALMKQTQMNARLEHLSQLQGMGRCNIFTCLSENGVWTGGYFVPRRRFCAVPIKFDPELNKEGEKKDEESKGWWVENVNSKAENEIAGHCSMFQRDRNDGYEALLETSGKKIVGWVLGVDLREVIDMYVPDELRAAKSHEEGQWVDDDGKVKEIDTEGKKSVADAVGAKRKSSVVLGVEETNKEQQQKLELVDEQSQEQEEDEQQLKAIISCQGLPQPEDGGISEEVLQQAMDIPLPGEEEEVLKAAANVPLPLEGDDEKARPGF
ncbi:hypothetical protein HYALB_00005015 [Hymenoscyphus albidus]|uniref:DUF676 domain-containing protein n=1 Tax=Hymenoscyphus albidus TaxID=595503 RepID=A0A9N9Q2G0_9HELO|nr:hypothetical protein HYALB_00005015 [Hymenoscyphus albidus]